ncbi:hypothetical protein CLOLEP_00718 [[Clostridium] leptum DSM 753]|uniref:Uncharacterized protein n=1 Tax=[Clostridium] leptum DSM 753 TaxID=428125 RepID=A7VQ91_9FIRM|nr:hypothetical protein CLOLEP_00718 [[Clostridium] leptum DSM 753]
MFPKVKKLFSRANLSGRKVKSVRGQRRWIPISNQKTLRHLSL